MRMGQNQKYIVKVMDKETQTNDDYVPENTKYQILQEKYDQLKNDYLKITSLFTGNNARWHCMYIFRQFMDFRYKE